MIKEISSVQNSYIKELIQLKEKSRIRKKTERFLIEGIREISLAIKGGYRIETLLFYSELCPQDHLIDLTSEASRTIEISRDVYQKLAYRETTEGIIAIAQSKTHIIDDLIITNKNPFLLIAEAPEKPGNIGALLRTADAAKADAVIIANPKTDLYNPNIIRSSVGCVFTNHVVTGSTADIIAYLKTHKINIFCAALQASETYHTQDYTKPTAIVVGTEATGLSDLWLENSTQNIMIPMRGEIDSMNVSVAGGILIFEVQRQRHFV